MKTLFIVVGSIILFLVIALLFFKKMLKKIDFDPDEEFLGN